MNTLGLLQSNWLKRASAAKGRIHHMPDVRHCRHPGQNDLVVEPAWYKLHSKTAFQKEHMHDAKIAGLCWEIFSISWAKVQSSLPCLVHADSPCGARRQRTCCFALQSGFSTRFLPATQ